MTDTLSRRAAICGLWLLLMAVAAFVRPAAAHELSPAIAELTVTGSGQAELRVDLNLEAVLAGIGPEHDDTEDAPQAATYDALRATPPEDLTVRFQSFQSDGLSDLSLLADGAPVEIGPARADIPEVGDTDVARLSTLRWSFALPPGTEVITWRFPERFGASIFRATREGAEEQFFAGFVSPGDTVTAALDPADGATQSASFLTYVTIGFDHILPKGLDHVLFVIGLFLLNTQMRPLLIQITMFTLAHTITLALGMTGVVSAPAHIVEPLIALSIAYVAVENIFTSDLHRWRTVIVFLFGLLHGLGFASVFREYAASGAEFVKSLVGFNIGVELGQLTVIALCYLAVGYWFGDKPWYRRAVVIPASLAIALISSYWVLERTGLLA
ncbi:HupE/UreJ family protein [Roseovarius aestuariivivens]|uniref:HupE/UreJ family protein n=1 Tax=Roseovarius aestuariivivens TaxID=1888910 RepID=UPI001436BE16|nr:HupE/UreJ family protein [Roseovarius aestuariivivens]